MTNQSGNAPTQPPTDGRPDGFDRLAEAGRVDYRMLTDGQTVTAENERQLAAELQDWRKDNARHDGKPFPVTKLAPLVGVSASVLTEWLRAKYKGDHANVAKLADQFLADERRKLGHHDFRQFTRINLTRKIFACIDAGLQGGTMPVIIGPPGACKTAHARAYSRERSGVLVLRIEDEPCNKRALTEIFCDVIQELRPVKAKPHRRRLDSIKSWLGKRRNTVLIIDEAQKLSRSGLELLRDLHDQSDPTSNRCMPIVFFGDEGFRKLIGHTKDGYTTKLQPQMIRRMVPVFDIVKDGGYDAGDLYSLEDILKIVHNNRVKLLTPQAARWLTNLANVHGYGLLGFAIAVLRQATALFRDMLAAQQRLDVEQLQESLQMTAGRSLAIEIDQATGGELLARATA